MGELVDYHGEAAQMRRWIDFLGVYSAPSRGVLGAV